MELMTTLNFTDDKFYDNSKRTQSLSDNVIIDMLCKVNTSDNKVDMQRAYIIRNSLEEFLATGNYKLLRFGANDHPLFHDVSCYNRVTLMLRMLSQGNAEDLFLHTVDKLITDTCPTYFKTNLLKFDDIIKILKYFGYTFSSPIIKEQVYNIILFVTAYLNKLTTLLNTEKLKKQLRKLSESELLAELYYLPTELFDFIKQDLNGTTPKKTIKRYDYHVMANYDKQRHVQIYKLINSHKVINGFRCVRESRNTINYVYSPKDHTFLFTIGRYNLGQSIYLSVVAITEQEAKENINFVLSKDITIDVDTILYVGDKTTLKMEQFKNYKARYGIDDLPNRTMNRKEWEKSDYCNGLAMDIFLPLAQPKPTKNNK